MSNKLFEIKNKDVTIVLEQSYGGEGQFEFYELYLNSEPTIRYRKSYYGGSPYDKSINNDNKYYNISDFVYNKLKELADKELEQYLNKNINNMKLYKIKDNSWGSSDIWFNLYKCKDEHEVKVEYVNSDYNEITEGIMSICYNHCHICKYDLNEGKFISLMEERYGKTKIKTPLEIIYCEDLTQLLLVEQYKRGTCHKAFTELVNLNKFLKDKKSIKILLKDGTEIKMVDKYSVRISDLLQFMEDNKFYINNSYDMKPRPSKVIDINELDCIQYGKNKYYINVENLKI